MALEVVWSEEAENQLDDIVEYLEENWTEKETEKLFKRLEDALKQVSEQLQRFKRSERKEGAREFQLSLHTTLFYSYNTERLEVLLLWPNKNDPANLSRLTPHP
ncbi:type II toxin-antitoxin system RelE/ParE family toxin [Cytophagaceae bacterium ABcell3]|nr:type II toxin-antitoxin system RelE/ParE family toxin [Cytophagaceae bacterium ABcell3]